MNPRRLVWTAFLALFLTAGCGLPKFILLDDTLTPQEHLDYGRALEEQGELERAEREYSLAARQNPLGHLYLGNLYFSQDDTNRAEKAYKKAIDGMPDNFEAYNNLAWLYYTRQTRLDRAEELARRALELAPADKKDQPRDTLEKIKTLRQSP